MAATETDFDIVVIGNLNIFDSSFRWNERHFPNEVPPGRRSELQDGSRH